MHVPELPKAVDPKDLGAACPPLDPTAYDLDLAGSPHRFGDYAAGERIDHVDGMTVEEAEHQIATRLYQNTAKVHFDQHAAKDSRFGRRLIYGGHVISLARALSFNGLANAFHVAADQWRPPRRAAVCRRYGLCVERDSRTRPTSRAASDVGALRIRTIATKNQPCAAFPDKAGEGYDPAVILDLDYWALMAL